MNLKSLRNKPSRNGFDLSHKQNFTAKAGELLPVAQWEVYPGDSFSIDLKTFTRTQPINTAAFARMREYYDFFFVPYELLWNKANTVFTQMFDNPQHATQLNPSANISLTGDFPYFTCEQIANYISTVSGAGGYTNFFGYNRGVLTAKLLECLGYGNFHYYIQEGQGGIQWSSNPLMANLELNAFSLLAYQKIYADFYRDSQWERISPSTFNVDYMSGQGDMNIDIPDITSSNDPFVAGYNLFDLRYCNWQKDLFHGVVPQAQYGSAAVVPFGDLTGALSRSIVGTTFPEPSAGMLGFGYTTTNKEATFDGSSMTNKTVKNDSATLSNIDGGISILLLRQYEALQKWKEISQSANKDFRDQISKHWNVTPSDAYSENVRYLGGIAGNLDINEVTNTNLAGDNSASLAGKGTGSQRGTINFKSEGEYGVIMCIYHCVPILDYTTDYVLPMHTKINAADFAIPEFDRIGMQGVNINNLINAPSSVGGTTGVSFNIGYAPRYVDLKTSFDRSIGGFKRELSHWVINYGNDAFLDQIGAQNAGDSETPDNFDDVQLNYTAFKVNPNCTDPIFVAQADSTIITDNFLCSTYFDVKAVRNLDTDGLPY